jgi:modulator of FtsH protease HflK
MEALKPFMGLVKPAIILGVLLIGVMSSFYTVPYDSAGVVQRFGALTGTVGPGLHFKIPFGVDRVEIVPVQRQLKLEFGFGTMGSTNEYQNSNEPELEKSMVTGDLNMALIEWSVQYRIDDAATYLFRFADPVPTLRDLSESVMREVVGDRTVDEVLTVGRHEIESSSTLKLQDICTKLEIGVKIDNVLLRNVNPPREVQLSFNEVNNAQQEKETSINQANAEYNRVIPRAEGEAEQKLSAAEGYALKRINEAEGDAGRFLALLKEYEKAPEVTRKRLYLERMAKVLPMLNSKVVVDEKVPHFLPMMNVQPGAPAN